MYRSYGFTKKACHFCSHEEVLAFNEHFYFCPNCAALYTFPIIWWKKCEHIKNRIPLALNKPCYKEAQEKVHISKEVSVFDGTDFMCCSNCGMECHADGW